MVLSAELGPTNLRALLQVGLNVVKTNIGDKSVQKAAQETQGEAQRKLLNRAYECSFRLGISQYLEE